MFKPILAGAVLAVSLSACQGMSDWAGGSQKTSSSSATSSSGTQGAAEIQALSPEMVRDIQRSLSSRGYDAGPTDGIYGASTQQALRNFQRDQKIQASGMVDAQSLAALGIAGATQAQRAQEYAPMSKRGAMLQQPSHGAKVSAETARNVQRELADRGYDVKVDGNWGRQSRQALASFQRDQNLRADGSLNRQTLAILGLEAGAPGTQTGQVPEEVAPPRSDGMGAEKP